MVRARRSSVSNGVSGTTHPAPAHGSPATALHLRTVSWKRHSSSDAPELGPAGVTDPNAVTFGFNYSLVLPSAQPVPPLAPVEYDMDEQDFHWLRVQNNQRRTRKLPPVSNEAFEIIMDRFEREWTILLMVAREHVSSMPGASAAGNTSLAMANGDAYPDDEQVDHPDNASNAEPEADEDPSRCAICDDGECENSNQIVYCDGCNLAVHQGCYGIPYIPEGQWHCRRCDSGNGRVLRCELCPHSEIPIDPPVHLPLAPGQAVPPSYTPGARPHLDAVLQAVQDHLVQPSHHPPGEPPTSLTAWKQTTQGTWVHLLCALWIPETDIAPARLPYMEPIQGVENVTKERRALTCYLCRAHGPRGEKPHRFSGACIECSHPTCMRAFHVTCARAAGLLTKLTRRFEHDDAEDEQDAWKIWCHKHRPSNSVVHGGYTQADRDAIFAPVAGTDKGHQDPIIVPDLALSQRSRKAQQTRLTQRHKSAQSMLQALTHMPVANVYMLNRIRAYVARLSLSHEPYHNTSETALDDKYHFIVLVAKYWALKRQARRGAPLIRRLIIDPVVLGDAPPPLPPAIDTPHLVLPDPPKKSGRRALPSPTALVRTAVHEATTAIGRVLRSSQDSPVSTARTQIQAMATRTFLSFDHFKFEVEASVRSVPSSVREQVIRILAACTPPKATGPSDEHSDHDVGDEEETGRPRSNSEKLLRSRFASINPPSRPWIHPALYSRLLRTTSTPSLTKAPQAQSTTQVGDPVAGPANRDPDCRSGDLHVQFGKATTNGHATASAEVGAASEAGADADAETDDELDVAAVVGAGPVAEAGLGRDDRMGSNMYTTLGTPAGVLATGTAPVRNMATDASAHSTNAIMEHDAPSDARSDAAAEADGHAIAVGEAGQLAIATRTLEPPSQPRSTGITDPIAHDAPLTSMLIKSAVDNASSPTNYGADAHPPNGVAHSSRPVEHRPMSPHPTTQPPPPPSLAFSRGSIPTTGAPAVAVDKEAWPPQAHSLDPYLHCERYTRQPQPSVLLHDPAHHSPECVGSYQQELPFSLQTTAPSRYPLHAPSIFPYPTNTRAEQTVTTSVDSVPFNTALQPPALLSAYPTITPEVNHSSFSATPQVPGTYNHATINQTSRGPTTHPQDTIVRQHQVSQRSHRPTSEEHVAVIEQRSPSTARAPENELTLPLSSQPGPSQKTHVSNSTGGGGPSLSQVSLSQNTHVSVTPGAEPPASLITPASSGAVAEQLLQVSPGHSTELATQGPLQPSAQPPPQLEQPGPAQDEATMDTEPQHETENTTDAPPVPSKRRPTKRKSLQRRPTKRKRIDSTTGARTEPSQPAEGAKGDAHVSDAPVTEPRTTRSSHQPTEGSGPTPAQPSTDSTSGNSAPEAQRSGRSSRLPSQPDQAVDGEPEKPSEEPRPTTAKRHSSRLLTQPSQAGEDEPPWKTEAGIGPPANKKLRMSRRSKGTNSDLGSEEPSSAAVPSSSGRGGRSGREGRGRGRGRTPTLPARRSTRGTTLAAPTELGNVGQRTIRTSSTLAPEAPAASPSAKSKRKGRPRGKGEARKSSQGKPRGSTLQRKGHQSMKGYAWIQEPVELPTTQENGSNPVLTENSLDSRAEFRHFAGWILEGPRTRHASRANELRR